MEEYERAKNRGADILGEVIGFSCNNNGGDMILPNIQGITETLRLALQDAKLSADQVGFISSHATATKMGDVIEAKAIYNIYKNLPYVTALKSYMGHTMGACGAIETIITLYMMAEGIVIPTLNLKEVDERCNMIRHTKEIREHDIQIASVQNFAFGGVNTCLIIKKM